MGPKFIFKVVCGVLVLTAATLLLVGFTSEPSTKTIVRHEIEATEELDSKDSNMYPIFVESPIELTRTYYVFNVTNPSEVLTGDGVPELEQIGPFVYREQKDKFNITWVNGGNEIRFFMNRTWVDMEMSVGDPKHVSIFTMNVALVGLANQLITLPIRHPWLNHWKVNLVEELLNVFNEQTKQTIVQKVSVFDMLFGVEDPDTADLMQELQALIAKKGIQNITLKAPVQPVQPKDPLAVIPSSVYSGKGNHKEIFTYSKFLDADTFGLWKGCDETSNPNGQMYNGQADKVDGTDGLLFPKFLSMDKPLRLLHPDLMRTIPLNAVNKTTVKGIDAYEYHIPTDVFQNETENPSNCAYNLHGPSGVLNYTDGAEMPIYVSFPYFTKADEYYMRNLSLVVPDQDLSSYWRIEPTTGFSLEFKWRYQYNLQTVPSKKIMALHKAPEAYVPLAWMEESGLVSDSFAKSWKSSHPVKGVAQERIIGIAGGAGVFVVVAVILAFAYLQGKTKRRGPNGTWLEEEEEVLINNYSDHGGDESPTEGEREGDAEGNLVNIQSRRRKLTKRKSDVAEQHQEAADREDEDNAASILQSLVQIGAQSIMVVNDVPPNTNHASSDEMGRSLVDSDLDDDNLFLRSRFS